MRGWLSQGPEQRLGGSPAEEGSPVGAGVSLIWKKMSVEGALSAPHPTQAGRQALEGRLTCPGVWPSPFSSPSTPGLLLLFLTQAWTKSPTHKNTIRTTYLKGKPKVTSHQIAVWEQSV